MNELAADLGVVLLIPALAIAVATRYFLRVRIERPPIGVYTPGDVAAMLTAVIVIPVIYLALPAVLVGTLLCLISIFATHLTLAPILPGRSAIWIALGAAAVNLMLHLRAPELATIWNNLLLLTLVVGVSNLYAQSGIKARDVAGFALLLSGYDLVATVLLPTMGDLLRKTIHLPFAPVFASAAGPDPVVIGLGDVLMLTLWTLVSIKGYGRAAGWMAAGTAVTVTGALALAMQTGLLTGSLPVMAAAGPLMALQYVFQRMRWGRERTTAAYRGLAAPGTSALSTEIVQTRLIARLQSMD